MTIRILSLVALVGQAAILSGCVAGYNALLFATKTNVGLQVDTQPPKVSLDIGRYEGLLSPSYEDGKTPPVLAAFKFDSESFLSNYLGSAMATGNASIAMARLYNAPDWPEATDARVWNITKDQWEEMEGRFDSGINLHTLPQLPWPLKQAGPGSVNPVLFGTDTSLGFKVAWSGIQATIPDYIRLAYQRRELAYAAVTIGRAEGAEGPNAPKLVARTPSLLATVDVALETQKFLESRVGYLQYFASGRAATALALRKDVRQAMTRRLDPEQGERMAEADYIAEYRGNTCQGLRARVLLWWADKTPVTVETLTAASEAAKLALDGAAEKTEALKKALHLAEERLRAARFLESINNPPATSRPQPEKVNKGAIRETVLTYYLQEKGKKAAAGIWVYDATCEEVEEAAEYFAIP